MPGWSKADDTSFQPDALQQHVDRRDNAGQHAVPSEPSPSSLEEFESFYREHFRLVVGFLMAIGASAADADDAAQEAMVGLHRRWGQVDAPHRWVRVVARRLLVRRAERARQREWLTSSIEDLEALFGPSLPALDHLDAQVWPKLERLPGEDFRILLLMKGHDFSSIETAKMLGITPAAARKRLARAMERARGLMEAIVDEDE